MNEAENNNESQVQISENPVEKQTQIENEKPEIVELEGNIRGDQKKAEENKPEESEDEEEAYESEKSESDSDESYGKKKKRSKKQKKINKKVQPKNHFIDFEALNTKSSKNFSIFEVFISILEVVWNKEYYNLNSSDSSALFWRNAISLDNFKKVFSGNTSETLRKYWNMVRQIINLEKTAIIMNKLKLIKNSENLSLKRLSIFVLENNELIINEDFSQIEKNFINFIESELAKKEITGNFVGRKKRQFDFIEEDEAETTKKEENNENNDPNEEVKSEVCEENKENPVKEEDLKENSNQSSSKNEKVVKAQKVKVKKIVIKDKKKREFINNTVITFKDIFKDKKFSDRFIIKSLEKFELDFQKTYDYLNGPEENLVDVERVYD